MIRAARAADTEILTKLTFASKGHWGYPQHYFEIWRPELTITADYIEENIVNVQEEAGRITGYYSLVRLVDDLPVGTIVLSRGLWLEHFFVDPALLGRGIGTTLFKHVCVVCRELRTDTIKVLADPHARGFYESLGWQYLREMESTIEGRTTPLLQFDF